jgi:hypothetical protein
MNLFQIIKQMFSKPASKPTSKPSSGGGSPSRPPAVFHPSISRPSPPPPPPPPPPRQIVQGQTAQAGNIGQNVHPSIQSMIASSSQKYNVPLPLLTTQIKHESSFNPMARHVNTDGSVDRGIAQINDKAHPEISDSQAYDPQFAIDWMGKTMGEKFTRLGSWDKALSEYNTGSPTLGIESYAKPILQEANIQNTPPPAGTGLLQKLASGEKIDLTQYPAFSKALKEEDSRFYKQIDDLSKFIEEGRKLAEQTGAYFRTLPDTSRQLAEQVGRVIRGAQPQPPSGIQPLGPALPPQIKWDTPVVNNQTGEVTTAGSPPTKSLFNQLLDYLQGGQTGDQQPNYEEKKKKQSRRGIDTEGKIPTPLAAHYMRNIPFLNDQNV